MRRRRCTECEVLFEPRQMGQKVCSIPCASAYAQSPGGRARQTARIQKARTAETRRRKAAAKTLGQWAKEAQTQFNKWIRLRDQARPCVSCGTYEAGQWHASHYKSVGGHPELRFAEQNVHKACRVCNEILSGNLIEYRKGLVLRIGEAEVLRLEGPQEPKHYTADDLREIKRDYAARVRKLEKEAA